MGIKRNFVRDWAWRKPLGWIMRRGRKEENREEGDVEICLVWGFWWQRGWERGVSVLCCGLYVVVVDGITYHLALYVVMILQWKGVRTRRPWDQEYQSIKSLLFGKDKKPNTPRLSDMASKGVQWCDENMLIRCLSWVVDQRREGVVCCGVWERCGKWQGNWLCVK